MGLVDCCCDCGFVCVVSFVVLWLRCGLIVAVAVCILVLGFEFAWWDCLLFGIVFLWFGFVCFGWFGCCFVSLLLICFCLNGCVDDFSGCRFGWMVGFKGW